ncbi:MAG TPA: hypothetical protein VJ438_04055 [Candidatus Nanoarchaeia archaeon]|nr:hypothetical protein [Candidatus Nanoarchaeia archaeon]
MAITKDELEELLKELENYRGRHTELISVYVSADYDANSVQKQLESETSTAKNIKSTSTRKNVIEALEKIIRYLKGLKRTPDNGLALFAGNVSKVEGQTDLRLWTIEPPLPLKIRLYRCDKDFVLEPLREQMEVTEIFALLVMDRKEATIGMLEGKRIEVIQKMTSGVPSKVRAGGQCLSPDTLIMKDNGNIQLKDIQKGDLIKSFDFSKNCLINSKVIKKWKTTKKIIYKIISNRGHIFASADHIFFIYDKKGKIAKKITSELKEGDNLIYKDGSKEEILFINEENEDRELIDLEVENKNFIANGLIVHNSSQRFHRITEGLTKEFYKRISAEMKKIFYDNPKLKGILIGGPIPTKDEFIDGEYLPTKLHAKIIGRVDIGGSDESGLKELVERSQDILAGQEIIYEKKVLEKFFKALGETDLALIKEPAIRKAFEYGAVDTLVLSKTLDKNLAKELKALAEGISSKVEIVSVETEEGKQFENLGGMGALLRYKI